MYGLSTRSSPGNHTGLAPNLWTHQGPPPPPKSPPNIGDNPYTGRPRRWCWHTKGTNHGLCSQLDGTSAYCCSSYTHTHHCSPRNPHRVEKGIKRNGKNEVIPEGFYQPGRVSYHSTYSIWTLARTDNGPSPAFLVSPICSLEQSTHTRTVTCAGPFCARTN